MKELTDNQIKEADKMLCKMKKKNLLWYQSTTYSGGPTIIMKRDDYLDYLKQIKNKTNYFKVAKRFQKILNQSVESGVIKIKEEGSPNCLYIPIIESSLMENIIEHIDEEDQSPVTSQAMVTLDGIVNFAVDQGNLEPVSDTPGLFRIK